MPRILHTADWHLGARLAQRSREEEHRAFLGWLADEVRRRAIDAVLVAGDVFERSQPGPSSLRLFFDGVSALAAAGAEVVVLAGDYDGPVSLEAPRAPLRALGISVAAQAIERVSLRSGLEVVALPPASRLEGEDLEAFVRRAVPAGGPASFVLMHHGLAGEARLAPRQLPGPPVDDRWFPSEVGYVALGHDHALGRDGRLGCPGSPVPLRFAEVGPRTVLEVSWDGGDLEWTPIEVPRFRDLVILEGTPEAIEAGLLALSTERGQRPLVSARVTRSSPDPTLLPHLAAIAERVGVELVEVRQDSRAAPASPVPRLSELEPEAVFRMLLRRRNERLDPDVLAAFSRIADEVK